MKTSTPRLCRPERSQVAMRCLRLEQMLADDHVAGVVWVGPAAAAAEDVDAGAAEWS